MAEEANKLNHNPPDALGDDEHRADVIKRSEAEGRRGIGQPGIESASGRDRAGTEFPRNFGTNVNDADIDAIVPPQGAVQGTRVGDQGDPTGATDEEKER